MPVKKTFAIKTCEECLVSFAGPGDALECRLNPPQPISAYASAYPVVRPNNNACFSGIVGSVPTPPKKVKVKK